LLSELLVVASWKILAEPAPWKMVSIRLHRLTPDNLSIETPASKDVTPASVRTDVADRD
jgi:hypothetical protein